MSLVRGQPCPLCGKKVSKRPPKRYDQKGRPRSVNYEAITNMKRKYPNMSLRELAHRNKCSYACVQRALSEAK